MLTVTDNAKQELRRKLQVSTDDPEVSLRLESTSSGELALMLGREEEGDQVIEYEGAKVLLVASKLASVTEGITLDVQDTDAGPKLVVIKT